MGAKFRNLRKFTAWALPVGVGLGVSRVRGGGVRSFTSTPPVGTQCTTGSGLAKVTMACAPPPKKKTNSTFGHLAAEFRPLWRRPLLWEGGATLAGCRALRALRRPTHCPPGLVRACTHLPRGSGHGDLGPAGNPPDTIKTVPRPNPPPPPPPRTHKTPEEWRQRIRTVSFRDLRSASRPKFSRSEPKNCGPEDAET